MSVAGERSFVVLRTIAGVSATQQLDMEYAFGMNFY